MERVYYSLDLVMVALQYLPYSTWVFPPATILLEKEEEGPKKKKKRLDKTPTYLPTYNTIYYIQQGAYLCRVVG